MDVNVWDGYSETKWEGEIDDCGGIIFTFNGVQFNFKFEGNTFYVRCYDRSKENILKDGLLTASDSFTVHQFVELLAADKTRCDHCGDLALNVGGMWKGGRPPSGVDDYKCIHCGEITKKEHVKIRLFTRWTQPEAGSDEQYYLLNFIEIKKITGIIDWLCKFAGSNWGDTIPSFRIMAAGELNRPAEDRYGCFLDCIDYILTNSRYNEGWEDDPGSNYGGHTNDMLDHYMKRRK